MIRRDVRDGERLSGHPKSPGEFPEIHVLDGVGPGGGSLMFGIQSFHWADVAISGDTTDLAFEGRVRVRVVGGSVQYLDCL